MDAIMEPDALSVLFQPIFEISPGGRRLRMVEGLIRGPKGTNVERADVLFEYVRRKQAECVVDRLCIEAVLREAKKLPFDCEFAINVHGSTLSRDEGLVPFLVQTAEADQIPTGRITLEIIDSPLFGDKSRFYSSLESLRDLGMRIAVDDAGLGQTNYRMMLECRPDYFKVHRHVVGGCGTDLYREAVIESISHLVTRFGAKVVADGIENVSDLNVVGSKGIELVQGFLLCPPVTAMELMSADFIGGKLMSAAAPMRKSA